MNPAEQIRSDLLESLERLKAAHHALADGQNATALMQADAAVAILGDVRRRLAPLATRVPFERAPDFPTSSDSVTLCRVP